VSSEEAEHFAAREGMRYVETSARTGLNVEHAFSSLAGQVLQGLEAVSYDLRIGVMQRQTGGVKVEDSAANESKIKKKKKKCC
jgi:Ras-related protein Rab-39B